MSTQSTPLETDKSFNDYVDLKNQIDIIKLKTRPLIRDAVLGAARQVFLQHPKVLSFSLHGYTPSFNDGDSCEFTFAAEAYRINGSRSPNYGGDDGDDDEDIVPILREDWVDGREYLEVDGKWQTVQVKEPGWAAAANNTIKELFGKFDERDLEAEFDTNFELQFTRPENTSSPLELTREDFDCGH